MGDIAKNMIMIMLQDFMDPWTFNQKNLMKCCKEFFCRVASRFRSVPTTPLGIVSRHGRSWRLWSQSVAAQDGKARLTFHGPSSSI